jgi:predicted ATPase/DNA-binding winged helix-turn-helix (wHTH) protein
MTANPSGNYGFGRFELQPDERRLLAEGAPVRVGRHAFDLLIALVERSGHLVTKDELFDRVWPKLVVEENTLQAHVSALRKILGPDAIATVSGRGYRFTLAVTPAATTPTSPSVPAQHNLPQQLTSFIGREKEVAELNACLRTTRLLTLTGAGGCGKTRLAMQVAAAQAPEFQDGIWLVEFAPLADAGLVPQTVADVLMVKEQPGASLTQTITERLQSKRLLLLLDNAEHVLGACAQLADALLRVCARLAIVVTSRERLGIAGEFTYRVPSLSVPDPMHDVRQEQIVAHESARLFIERARLQGAHFAITAENVSALASICHRLDGIPLAIELAAPRVRSMSLKELSRRLDQRFDLLTGGSRTALPRQRTLRSLIDWSYDLLGGAEKLLLNRLSVFAGGCTLEAAERVCAGTTIDAGEVLDLLTSLVDKSLVVADERDGATRYVLLETVRHYARDQLQASGEEAETQRRHLAGFIAIAEASEQSTMRFDQRSVHQLDPERDNVRAALSRTVAEGGDVAGGMRLAGAMSLFWSKRGDYTEGRAWFAALLAAARPDTDEGAMVRALRGAGRLAQGQNDFALAEALCLKGLAICRASGNHAIAAQFLTGLGALADDQGKLDTAREHHREALAIRRATGDHAGISNSLLHLGHVMHSEGDYASSRLAMEEALAIARNLGDPEPVEVLAYLADSVYRQGDYSAARELAHEALTVQKRLGLRPGIAMSLKLIGLIACEQGDVAAARHLFCEMLAIAHDVAKPSHIANSLECLAKVATKLARPLTAARIWGASERLFEEIGARADSPLRETNEKDVQAARVALSDDPAFDAAWKEGRAMTLERAVRYARDMDDPAQSP